MIPGHYINLDAADARRGYMEREIARLNLPITRFPAVIGKTLPPETVQKWHPESGEMHRLSPSEVACYLSHLGIWRRIADGPARFGAVYEDDIRFSEASADFLCSDAWIPQGVDAIKLETSRRWVKLGAATDASGRLLAPLKSRHLAAGGYILSKELATRLVEQLTTIRNPVDYDLFDPDLNRLGGTDVWQLCPAICVQQVRAGGQVFLPEGAASSDLDAIRGTEKRSGFDKLKTELSRPFRDVARIAAGKLWALRTGGQFKIVPFE